jgi:hypothetical protein
VSNPSHIRDVGDVTDFVLAGNATFTIRSVKTDMRFTYKVKKCPNPAANQLYFVSVLTGQDNVNDFQYLGIIRAGNFVRGHKSHIGEDAPSHRAMQWFWDRVGVGTMPDSVECWHEGKCGRCGRKLTVPDSIARGIGPECAQHMPPPRQKRLL